MPRNKNPSKLIARLTSVVDEDEFEQLVTAHPEVVHQRDNMGKAGIHYAAAAEDPFAFNILIRHGANPNLEATARLIEQRHRKKRGKKTYTEYKEEFGEWVGQSPLHFACGSGRDGVVRMLCEMDDIEKEKRDANGRTPFLFAVEMGHENVVRTLLTAGVDSWARDETGKNALHIASKFNRLDILKFLFEHDPLANSLVRQSDVYGNTPLHVAVLTTADRGPLALQSQNDIYCESPDDEDSSRYHEFYCGSVEVVQLLLAQRCTEINQPNFWGLTPLHLAVYAPLSTGILEALVGNTACNLNAQDIHGRTALHFAVNIKYPEWYSAVDILMEAGANLNLRDLDGYTALHNACRKPGFRSAVSKLLSSAEVNTSIKDESLKTALDLVSDSCESMWADLGPLFLKRYIEDGKFGDFWDIWSSTAIQEGCVSSLDWLEFCVNILVVIKPVIATALTYSEQSEHRREGTSLWKSSLMRKSEWIWLGFGVICFKECVLSLESFTDGLSRRFREVVQKVFGDEVENKLGSYFWEMLVRKQTDFPALDVQHFDREAHNNASMEYQGLVKETLEWAATLGDLNDELCRYRRHIESCFSLLKK